MFKIKDIDQGFCRVLYETKNSNDERIYYCIQQEGQGMGCVFYRCSGSPWFEPDRPVAIRVGMSIDIEVPAGNTELEEAVRDHIICEYGMKGFEYGTEPSPVLEFGKESVKL